MPSELTGVRSDHKYSYQKLEKLAAYVRQQLKISPHDATKPLVLFEGLDDITIQCASGPIPLRHGVVTLEDSEGYTKYDRERGVIEVLASEQTYAWLEVSHPRATYFVAHELGHCVLHTEQLVRLAQMPTMQLAAFHRGKTEHKPYEDTEWQANAFASALLMPAQGLLALEQKRGSLIEYDVSERFGVSNEAAGYRIELFATRRGELLRP
jgi:hypothetical protein